MMLSILLFLFFLYLLLILNYTNQWLKIPVFKSRIANEQRAFTVLIPARNEASNIGSLLLALQGQNYPSALIEVIVIDDQSTDQTPEIIRQFPHVRLLQQPNDPAAAGKKRSIERGIEAARHDWILTTDADCMPAPQWIATVNAYLDRTDVVCLVGPITLPATNSTLLHEFQRYDNLMFQGITGAAIESNQHTLGNGANLCYRKEAFRAVGGFDRIDTLASGDDVLLIEKFMRHYPRQVRFLKSGEALVKTQAANTWKQLWQQRVRWASKAPVYQQLRLQIAQALTGLFNLAQLIQTLYCFIHPADWNATLSSWIFKALIEWPLVRSVAMHYRERHSFLLYLLLQPVHVSYLVAIGLFGRRKQYSWKGRAVR